MKLKIIDLCNNYPLLLSLIPFIMIVRRKDDDDPQVRERDKVIDLGFHKPRFIDLLIAGFITSAFTVGIYTLTTAVQVKEQISTTKEYIAAHAALSKDMCTNITALQLSDAKQNEMIAILSKYQNERLEREKREWEKRKVY